MANLLGSGEIINNESEEFCRFNQTLEKLSKNKINKNNAFESRIINEIDAFFQKSSLVLNEFEWNKYTTWLDGSGKIYALCVDFLYEETIKVLGGVNRSTVEDVTDQKILISKRVVHAPNTLETNEAAINCFSYNKINPTNPYFKLMSKKFDSSTSDSWLLNITTINSELDFVLTAGDAIFSSVFKREIAEVNLEKIVSFSLNDLVEVDFCEYLKKMESAVVPSSNKTFEEIFTQIDKNCELNLKFDENSSFEDFEIEDVSEKTNSDYNSQSIEERILPFNDFYYTNPKNSFPTAALDENVTKKRKKRKREENSEEESEEHIFAMIKIEEDDCGVNLLKETDKRSHKTEKNIFFNYRQARLGELFSHFGKFFKVSTTKKDLLDPCQNYDPLSLDSFEPIEPQPLSSINSEYLDIKSLKDAIWKIIKDKHPNCEFLDIINELPNHLKDMRSLSVHSCFVTILLLANEYPLTLKKLSESNFRIIHEF